MRYAAIILLTLQMAGFAVAQQPFVPDANTVALWHFDEGAGLITHDAGSNEIHGLVRGTPEWSTGRFGAGFHFNGNLGGDSVWSRSYGAESYEFWTTINAMPNGDYILAGSSSGDGAIVVDLQLARTTSSGDILWTRKYDYSGWYDWASSCKPTSDGGFILAGTAAQLNISFDMWLVKTDGDGNLEWSRNYGGSLEDGCESVIQTADGGYLLQGYTYSFGSGDRDMWLLKTNSQGDSLWSQTFGGAQWETSGAVIQTANGDFVSLGHTYSYGAGAADYYLIRLSSVGNPLWTRTIGGIGQEWGTDLLEMGDGSLILLGTTSHPSVGELDFGLVKTDADGNPIWQRTYGTPLRDWPKSLVQTPEGEFYLAGFTINAGNADYWVVKTSATGDSLWSRRFGGAQDDVCYDAAINMDGTIGLAGDTKSFGGGDSDCWLLSFAGPFGDHINMGNSSLFCPPTLTIDAWVNADSIRPGSNLIVTNAKDFHGYRLFLDDGGKPAFDVQDGSFEGYNIAMSPDPITTGEWHMLRGTFDGSMVRIYVDGVFRAETSGILSPATYPLHIGADVTSPFVSDPFLGTVDEVRISDIARDPSTCGCADPVGLSAAVWQCEEGSGDTLHDATLHNNHGVLMNGTGWASGICGSALDIDGANDYVEVPDSPPLDITGPLTIQFSFYPRSEPTSGIQHLIGKTGDGSNNTDWVYVVIFGEAGGSYNPQGLYFQLGIENGAVAVYDPTPVPLNEWTCVTATFDGDSMKILVNGELRVAQSVNVQMVENDEPLLIGTGRYHTNFFDGRIDAIRIFPYDITDGTPSLTVVGPGLGDEWRVAQPNASCVEWSEVNLTGNVRVDLYRNSALAWNITNLVPAVQETLCVTLPCSVEAGTGYQILVQSLDDTTIRDLGDQFRVEPQCGPLHPDSGLVIHVESGIDVHLYWPVVTQDSCGGMLCGPVYYIVWYEATNGENFDFLGYTQDTLYTHAGVKAFESQMFYNVTTFNGSLSTITSALRDLGPHFSHREFVTYVNRERKSAEAMD